MAPVSLKIVLDNGAVTRKVKFDTTTKVDEAHDIVKDKIHRPSDGKEYGLFLRSADDDLSGVWLEGDRTLDYYMLRDGDTLDYLCRIRNLRVKMLDGTVKTLQVDEGKPVGALMFTICSKIGISNHDEYGLCMDVDEDMEESKDGKHQPTTGTLTLTRKTPQKEKDVVLEQLIKKHKTDDNVQWLDQHRTLREIGVDPQMTLLLKRRFYYSDRNVDSRDPVQLNLLYVQIRDVILSGRQPVTEEQAFLSKSRWINIRDMMRRKIRDRIRKGAIHVYKYKYEDELKFMIPHFREHTAENNEEYGDFVAADLACESDIAADFVDETVDYENEGRESKPSISFQKRVSEPNSLNGESSYQESSTDPIDGFLITIGSTLRKFSPYYLNQAKSKIFQVVQNYELQQILNIDDQQAASSELNR